MALRYITEVVEIFLYNEEDRSVLGEYRYLADGNDGLLRSYILDRIDWSNSRYSEIFRKGVIVRLNPNNEPWEEGRSISNTILPIVKDGSETEEFGAFRPGGWTYPCKSVTPSSSLLESDAFMPQTDTSRGSILRPRIVNWVSGIPALGDIRPSQSFPTDNSAGVQAFRSNQYPSHGQLVDVSGSDDSITEETGRISTSPSVPTTDNGSARVTLESPEPVKRDPFAHIWREFRATNAGLEPRTVRDHSIEADLLISPSNEGQKPRLAQSEEKNDRSFHQTMKQKAGSRTIPGRIFPEFDPTMMISINKSLENLMAPLRMLPGSVDFRLDLGRFCFTNVGKSHIQRPEDKDDDKYYRLDRIRNELNKRHTSGDKLFFTRVLTSLGADANYIARINDSNGNQMWERPTDGRSSIYEFTCRSRPAADVEHEFVVEIDATEFTSKVKAFKPDQNCFAVHCTKRVWDFQIVLSVSQNLDDEFGSFAKDLVRSLQVM